MADRTINWGPNGFNEKGVIKVIGEGNIGEQSSYNIHVYTKGLGFDPSFHYSTDGYENGNFVSNLDKYPCFVLNSTGTGQYLVNKLFVPSSFSSDIVNNFSGKCTYKDSTGAHFETECEAPFAIWYLCTDISGDYPWVDTVISTNLPIFDDAQVAEDYYNTGIITDGRHLINSHIESQKYYLSDVFTTSGDPADKTERYYQFSAKKLALYKDDTLTGLNVVLTSYDEDVIAFSADDPNDEYERVSSYPDTWIRENQGRKYLVYLWDTNIYYFEGDENATGKQKADSFCSGLPAPDGKFYDKEDAVNFKEIAQRENIDLDGVIGEVTNVTETGLSPTDWGAGVRAYALGSGTAKNVVISALFNETSNPVNDVLNGVKLFDSNAFNAIQGLFRIAVPASDICTLDDGTTQYKIGSYTAEAGKTIYPIRANNKIINCGQHLFKRTYNDYRDYEPYCKIFLILPYCGTYPVPVSAIINKTVKITYAVSIGGAGACTAYLYADNCIISSYDGNMGEQIPFVATDRASQVSSVMRNVSQGLTGSLVAAQGLGGNAHALLSGGTMIADSIANMPQSMALGYMTRGGYSSNLGDFGVMSPTFVFQWQKSVVPANEIALVGKPSNKGGAVGNFSGFLLVSAFNMTNGFGGTDTELEEIYTLLRNGVYVS